MQSVSRRKIAAYIAEQLAGGAKPAPLMSQAAAYLLEHKQVGSAELLVRDIESVLAQSHGIVLANITSARELSAGIISNIERFVQDSEQAKRVEISTHIEPSLIGGVIIKTPRAEMDASIRKQLNELRA